MRYVVAPWAALCVDLRYIIAEACIERNYPWVVTSVVPALERGGRFSVVKVTAKQLLLRLTTTTTTTTTRARARARARWIARRRKKWSKRRLVVALVGRING
jgi:hypothetical protein